MTPDDTEDQNGDLYQDEDGGYFLVSEDGTRLHVVDFFDVRGVTTTDPMAAAGGYFLWPDGNLGSFSRLGLEELMEAAPAGNA